MKTKILSYLKSHIVYVAVGIIAGLVPIIAGLHSWQWWTVALSIVICSFAYPIQQWINLNNK
jgi:hypothetical protein